MWVPDHLNEVKDYVPSHYYFLRVTNDIFATEDRYELEEQVYGEEENSTATPWIFAK